MPLPRIGISRNILIRGRFTLRLKLSSQLINGKGELLAPKLGSAYRALYDSSSRSNPSKRIQARLGNDFRLRFDMISLRS